MWDGGGGKLNSLLNPLEKCPFVNREKYTCFLNGIEQQ